MIGLILAAALVQAAAADPCQAADAPPGLAHCPAWREIGSNAGASIYVDPASLRRNGTGFEIEIRLVLLPIPSEEMRSSVGLFAFDCARRTYAIRRMTAYDAGGRRVADEPMRDSAGPGDPGQPVPPDSADAFLLAEYCPH